MTCIVGLEHDGSVYLGSDAFSGGEGFADLLVRPKIHRVGPMLFGHAGSSRRNGVLLAFLGSIAQPKRWNESEVVRRVIPEMIRVLDAHGVRHRHSSTGDDESGGTLFCAGGRVFEIGSAMNVVRSRYGYAAIGSGEKLALGSLASTAALGDIPPTLRVRLALEAAERHTPTVRRPWKMLTLKSGKAVTDA